MAAAAAWAVRLPLNLSGTINMRGGIAPVLLGGMTNVQARMTNQLSKMTNVKAPMTNQ
jgi:hypothetical protein